MRQDEPEFGRMRNPSIDFIKLQLLVAVNQLRLESLLHKAEHRKTKDSFFSSASNREQNKDVTFEVVAIQDRVNYILEIAKNLLRDESDPDNNEYHEFENMVKAILGIKLIKKKYFGLKKKAL
ncbi:MAG: hypothetical protein KGH87_05205 [Thaumarchaeota archaeon]|nr:hypothetical protein [Nitrososphaerota archaeon]MDE1839301.1 hypothetical protein [Nitrososphaerota archaeon]